MTCNVIVICHMYYISVFRDFIKEGFEKIIIRDYICCHRKYDVSLKYIKHWKRWVLDKWDVPCKDDMMELFKKKISDEKLEETIVRIYTVLKKHTQILARYRRHRKRVSHKLFVSVLIVVKTILDLYTRGRYSFDAG